ncbi:hypothetical protein Tco_0109554 [Tanacetum coccineum]
MIVETIHVNFDELPQMASNQVSSDPGLQCLTTVLEQDSLSLGPQCQENVPQVAETVTTSNELELLYSLMFSELLNGNSPVVYTDKTEGETSSPSVDSSNMHTFYQHHPSAQRWTKDHPLEQVIGNPSQSVRTRRQLEIDGEMIPDPPIPSWNLINQAKYAQEILKKHGMTSCDSIGTLMATKHLDADLSGGDKLVSWSSKKQDCTSMSSAEAESYALSWKPCQGDSLNLPDHRAQVDQGSQIKMIQVKEMMQDNDLKNSKSKDKGSRSRSQSMNEQSHYKQDKTKTRQSINVKSHIFNVIGSTEEFEERDLNIGGDC